MAGVGLVCLPEYIEHTSTYAYWSIGYILLLSPFFIVILYCPLYFFYPLFSLLFYTTVSHNPLNNATAFAAENDTQSAFVPSSHRRPSFSSILLLYSSVL